MSEILLDLSDWIQLHQALVVAVGVPMLTALAAGIVSYSTTKMNLKAHKFDRELRERLQRSRSKLEKAEKLRQAFSQFSFISISSGLQVRKSLEERQNSEAGASENLKSAVSQIVDNAITELIRLQCEINLLMEVSHPDYDYLNEAIGIEIKSILVSKELENLENDLKFARITAKIVQELEQEAEELLH